MHDCSLNSLEPGGCSYRDTICKYHGILFETEIDEHDLFTLWKNPFGVTLIKVGPSGISMDEVGDNEEALVVESYKTFIEIKEEPDPGTFPLIFSLVFILIIPIFFIGFEGIFYGDSSLCFGSVLIGFALLGLGAILSSSQMSRYKKATKNLAHVAGIPKKIAYPFFSLQAADKRINSLVLQKYPFLSESKEYSNKSKPRKIVLSQREKE